MGMMAVLSVDDMCVMILTHGRADRVVTVNTLRKEGYSGQILLVIDDEDEQAEEYFKRYSDVPNVKVVQFNKQRAFDITDSGDSMCRHDSIVYARNMSFDIAESEGYRYFCILEDDYHSFDYRWVYKNKGKKVLKCRGVQDLDRTFMLMFQYLHDNSRIQCIAFAQAGDFIGGADTYQSFIKNRVRKCMNSFFCMTDRRCRFYGRMNDDVNTYTLLGGQGKVFLTMYNIALVQDVTQSSTGGLSDMYRDLGTHAKSFYSVMYCPSCVKLNLMGWHNMRIHHNIDWNNAVPKIISDRYKKV